MIPFYTFYSMFGFQRIGDQIWAAGDSRARGFLMGATAGRTTLNGEGLQHQDGQALLFASVYPSCQAYDPTFSYEVAVLVQKGIERMFEQGEDVFYYITLQNENYSQAEMPEGAQEGIHRGMYLFKKGGPGELRVQLMGSGSILREVIVAADLLLEDFGVEVDIWSILGVNQLHREGLVIDDWNRNHPEQPPEKSYVEQQLENHSGPVIISTDYVQAYPEQLRRLIPRQLTILGTDGYGRSDSREVLRRFFKIDRYHIVIAALQSLMKEGRMGAAIVTEALQKYGIDPEAGHAINR
jgi:pyruvate dehydrogenase E1 component